MANLGRCINCWWWNQRGEHEGYCFFWRNESEDRSYCPDFHNRKKGDKKETLEDFAKKHGETFVKYYKL